MAPSWPSLVPAHLHDGSSFPAMNAFALPSLPSSPSSSSSVVIVEPARVESLVQELLPLGVVPLNLADNLAGALIFGIQSVFNLQGQQRRQ